MGQMDAEVRTVTGDAPMTPSSADRVLISNGNGEAGLWLWHGEAPPLPSAAPQPNSQLENILARMRHAARRAGWIALPSGLALILLAASVMHSAPPQRPEPASKPAVSLPPAPSPTIARPDIAFPPAQLAEARFDQVRVPSAPAPQISVRGPGQRMVSWRPRHKSSRTVKKSRALLVHRGPPPLIVGVLMPPVMPWRGGGY